MKFEHGSTIAFILILVSGISAACISPGDDGFGDMPSPAECRKTIGSGDRMIVNETDNTSTICTSPDGPFSLQLNENSRTGFQWKISASSGLQVVDEGVSWYDENGAPTRMPGIRGIHQWTIFPKTPGIQRIRAVLQRPEGSTGHEQVFALNVMVNPLDDTADKG